MSHTDWKRYYMVVYDKPYWPLDAMIFKRRDDCYNHLDLAFKNYMKRAGYPKPTGVVGIRGKKSNVELQRVLWSLSR